MQSGSQHTVIHTAMKPVVVQKSPEAQKKTKAKTKKKRAGFSERLLRNTAISCALLLGILTLRNIDSPWSQAAVKGIESALTMRIDPDTSLGELSFVRSIVPESTLVFLNISGRCALDPVDGNISHEFREGQPWTVYECDEAEPVRSALAGNVSAVMQFDSGGWCAVIDHGKGIETMYAYMEKPLVDAGDSVSRGQQIGVASGGELYYEYRLNGESVEPGTGDAQ